MVSDMANEEIKEWRNNPTTKFMLAKVQEYANNHLSAAPTIRDNRDKICDEVQGIRMVLEFISSYEEDV